MFVIDFRSAAVPAAEDLVIPLVGEHQMLAVRSDRIGNITESRHSYWGPIPTVSRLQYLIENDGREFAYVGQKKLVGSERNVWTVVLNEIEAEKLVRSENSGTTLSPASTAGAGNDSELSKTTRPAYPKERPSIDGDLSFRGLRSVLKQVDHELASAIFRAMHLTRWRAGFKYCPACGAALADSLTEMARECPACKTVRYPVISPAIIVAITRGTELLLCRAHNNPSSWHSLVAGYMEAGERAEDTVAREVLEEVGLTVRDIRYWGSQPWPFSGSLMLGFRAEYDSGNIIVEPSEIDSAAWFPLDNLPELPPPPSIAHRLIVDTRRILTGI